MTQFLVLAVLWFAYLAFAQRNNHDVFWDLQLYARSLQTYLTGGSPYALRPQENFVYSPLFLKVGSLLSRLLTIHLLAALYLAVHCLAVLAIPFLIAASYLRSSWFTPALALLVFALHPGLNGQIALLSGNVSSLLYAAALLAGLPGIRRNKWFLFYLAVALGAMIKPQLLSLLLLPVFLGEGQLPASVITVLLAVSAKVAERLLWPTEYKAFLKAAYYQVVVLNDDGIGLIRYFTHYHLGSSIPLLHENSAYLVNAVVTGAILIRLWSMRKHGSGTIPLATWRGTILVTALLANPRIMPYEAAIAMVPATMLILESLGTLYRRGVKLHWLALPAIAFILITLRSPAPAVFLWLLCSVALVLFGIYPPFSARGQNPPAPS